MTEYRYDIQALTPIPQNHGYELLSALSRVYPELHGREDLQIAPIGGRRVPNSPSMIVVGRGSYLRMRGLSPDEACHIQGGQVMLGRSPIQIGRMTSTTLHPAPSLSTRVVIYRGVVDETEFLTRLVSQVEQLTGQTEVAVSLGRRRAVAVRGIHLLGYSVTLNNLTSEASLAIQKQGLGWGSSMGCGVFHFVGKRP